MHYQAVLDFIEQFKQLWAELDTDASSVLHANALRELLNRLPRPYGLSSLSSLGWNVRHAVHMHLELHSGQYVFFHDALEAVLRPVYGTQSNANPENNSHIESTYGLIERELENTKDKSFIRAKFL